MLDKSILSNLEQIKKSSLVFDLECCSFYPNGGKEINIQADNENYIQFAKVKWVGCYSYKYDKCFEINAIKNPEQILKLFSEHEVLIGFNSEEFDFPILVNNGFINPEQKYLQVDCMQILGINTFKNRSGYAYKNRAALMDVNLKNNSLRHMAEAFGLEHQKGDIDYAVFFKDEWTEEETKNIITYLHSDVMSTKGLFEALWNYWLPFAELLDIKDVYSLAWIRNSIASVTYKAACRVIGAEPTYAEKTEEPEAMGGNVFEPQVEEAVGVWYVDFASLYPHMFSMFNLPAEIIPENATSKQIIWHGNDVFKVRGSYDITNWHPLSQYIAGKLKERLTLKAQDPKNPMVYTLKIFLNGLYGVMRSAIFEKVHTPNCGYDCCWLGQQVQQLTKEMLEQFGFRIIYGDTDSLMFLTDEKAKNNKEYVLDCLSQIIDVIKDNAPFPVDTFKIAIENYLEYLMFPFSEEPMVGEDGKNIKEGNRLILQRKGKKKNYLYIYKDKEGKVDVKLVGLPLIKDNATDLSMKMYEEVLKPQIIANNRAKFPRSYIQSQVDDYLKRPEIMDLIAVEFKTKDISNYKNPSQIQAQISKAYFSGKGGTIRLIKNTKTGKAGIGSLYCTIQEALEAKLTSQELDLEKLWNELTPFVLYEEPQKETYSLCGIHKEANKDCPLCQLNSTPPEIIKIVDDNLSDILIDSPRIAEKESKELKDRNFERINQPKKRGRKPGSKNKLDKPVPDMA